ncbi:hypothetical protein [Bradyrhizobium sp. WSM2793]|uniref:hypothetical protein n=1 Tax=Bradyrhizobium sp. WSM2793 TaxID=1038866 RepID=UPI0012F8FD07|nr:hypothetical protein [Bradyrhizobium sp. WSM2793]
MECGLAETTNSVNQNILQRQRLTCMWRVLPDGHPEEYDKDSQLNGRHERKDADNNDMARHSHSQCAVRLMADFFLIIFGWSWLAPIFVTIVGGVFALRAQGRRWIIHLCVFGCLLAALPTFVSLWGRIDPDAASEPTNAFTALLYFIVMAGFGLAYSIFALVLFYTRRRIA